MIYFIHDRQSGAIKIGQCWGDRGPRQALTNCQSGNPRELFIVAVLNHFAFYDEDPEEPRLSVEWIKAKFRKKKIRLSWFQAGPVIDWLRGTCAKRFVIPDYNLIPQSKRYRRVNANH